MLRRYLNFIIILISAITILSGALQLVLPEFVLMLVGGEASETSRHFFSIIGMFMVLFGGLMLHTMYSANTSREAILWSALQKLGASAAVGLGIYKGLFAPMAAAVAGFDLLSGFIFFYWLNVHRADD